MTGMVTQFHFLRPEWLLMIIPVVVLAMLVWKRAGSTTDWQRVISPELAPYLLDESTTGRNPLPILILALGGIMATIAMAGPVWQKLPSPVFRTDAALVIVLDLSRSMDAQDVKPSRLQRAHFKIADILKARTEGQSALVVYAGDAFTVTPLTDDDETILSQLPALTTSLPPTQGSRTDRALELAIQLLKQASLTRGQVLLITDEVQPARGMEAAQQLASEGYQLNILGVGTSDGAPIPVNGGMLKNTAGDIVLPKLDADNLQRIAAAGNGRYATLSTNEQDIQHLGVGEVSQSEALATPTEGLRTDRWREDGPWLLLPLLLLAPLAFRRGLLVIACVLIIPLPQTAQAFSWDDLWQTPDQQAHQLFQQQDNAGAAQQFTDPAWRASANYRAKNFTQALQDFQALPGADARYNEGNTLAHMGKLEAALDAYDRALQEQPDHEDAIHNRKLVEDLLKQQQQQQQQQQQANQENPGADSAQPQAEARPPEQADADQQAESEREQSARERESPENKQARQPQAAANEPDEATNNDDRDHESDATMEREMQLSQEQWLKRIPDDPAGLLRRKFDYQYRQRARSSGEGQLW